MAEKEIKVKVDTSEAVDAINKLVIQLKSLDTSAGKANTELNKTSKKASESSISYTKMAATIGLATNAYDLAIQAGMKFIDFIKESISKASEEEGAQKRLLFALNGNKDAYNSLASYKEKLRKTTIFTKEEINGATNLTLSLGRTITETERMTKAAMGLSRVTGQDLQTILMQLNQTYEGQVGRLGRFEGSLKQLTKAQLANGEAVDILMDKYGKFATTGLETTAGQIIMLKKDIEELEDELGTKLLPIVRDVLKALNQLFMGKEERGWAIMKYIIAQNEVQIKALAASTDKYQKEEAKNLEKINNKLKERLKIHDQSKEAKIIGEENDLMKKSGVISADIIAKRLDDLKAQGKQNETKKRNGKISEEEYQNEKIRIDTLTRQYKEYGRSKEPPPGKGKVDKEKKETYPEVDRALKVRDELDKINSEITKNDIDHEKAKIDAIELLTKEDFDKQLQIIENLGAKKVVLKQNEIDKLKSFTGPETEDEQKLRLAKIEEIEGEIVKINDETNKEIKANYEAYIKWENDQNDELLKSEEEREKVRKEKAKELEEMNKEIAQNIKMALGEIANKAINALFDQAMENIQKELDKTLEAIDKASTKEGNNLDKLLKNKYISEAEYERRKEKLDKDKETREKAAKKEAAEKAKKAAFEQAVINALLAATMALATTMPTVPLGLVMAGVTLALGMADAAIIASKPLSYKSGTSKVPSFASGGFTSPYGDQNGIPAILHPNEGVLNSTAMSAPGMVNTVNALNTGQQIQTTTTLHPDSINSIIAGINNKQVFVSEYDITKTQNKVNVLQQRSTL